MIENPGYDLNALTIDEEFQNLIPPLTKEEQETLEATILSDGRIYFPMIVWNGTIIDGHNRYEILMKYPHLKYEIQEKAFASRDDAIVWICKNQLGRRNISDLEKLLLIGRQYEAEKRSRGGDRNMGHDENGQFTAKCHNDNLRPENTSQRIARENNVSPSYVNRAAQFVRGLDIAEEKVPGISRQILSGEIKSSAKDVALIAKAKPCYQQTISEQLAVKKNAKRRRKDFAEIDAIYADMRRPKQVGPESFMGSMKAEMKNMVEICENLFRICPALRNEKRYLADIVESLLEVKQYIEGLEQRLEELDEEKKSE